LKIIAIISHTDLCKANSLAIYPLKIAASPVRSLMKKRELVINIWQPNELHVVHAYNVPFLPIEKTQAYAVSIDLRH